MAVGAGLEVLGLKRHAVDPHGARIGHVHDQPHRGLRDPIRCTKETIGFNLVLDLSAPMQNIDHVVNENLCPVVTRKHVRASCPIGKSRFIRAIEGRPIPCPKLLGAGRGR